MTKQLQLMFSLISGEMYTILPEELEVHDKFQIPLLKKPKQNCKKCYGRFHIGKNKIHNIFIMCATCAPTCIDVQKLKSTEVPSNQQPQVNLDEYHSELSEKF